MFKVVVSLSRWLVSFLFLSKVTEGGVETSVIGDLNIYGKISLRFSSDLRSLIKRNWVPPKKMFVSSRTVQ